MSLAPVVAPLLGGVIATVAPWQAVFWALAGFGTLMLARSVLVVPETLPPHRRHKGGLGTVVANSWSVLRTPSHLFLTQLCVSFVMGNATAVGRRLTAH